MKWDGFETHNVLSWNDLQKVLIIPRNSPWFCFLFGLRKPWVGCDWYFFYFFFCDGSEGAMDGAINHDPPFFKILF